MVADFCVGNYVTLRRGITYKGTLVGKPGPALLGLGSIVPGGGFRNDFKTYGGECPPELMLVPGDLFVSLKGATKDGQMIGSIARVPSSVPSGRLTQDTVKLVFRQRDAAFEHYLYWLLRTPDYRSYCAGRATGSAVVALSRDDFLSYHVPPLTTLRKSIVDVLERIEDKIELNRRMNASLEAMARAIFKSWFVDFDPVRAKAEGRQPAGLDPAIAALFPESFEDSELGAIPRGWRVAQIGESVRIAGGSTPSTKNPEYWDGGSIHWATPKDLSALSDAVLLDTERKITESGLVQISSGLLPAGTMLMSSRAPIGYLAISEVPVAINQGFIAMVCDGPLSNHYVLRWTQANMDEIKGRSNGTTFMEISKANFRPMLAVVPPEQVMDAFDRVAGGLHRQIVANIKQSQTLAAQRDALLLKLLSGECRATSERDEHLHTIVQERQKVHGEEYL